MCIKDAWNRSVKATKAYRKSPDSVEGIGENGTGGVTLGDLTVADPYVSFAYDGLGRRINKSVRLGSTDAGAEKQENRKAKHPERGGPRDWTFGLRPDRDVPRGRI